MSSYLEKGEWSEDWSQMSLLNFPKNNDGFLICIPICILGTWIIQFITGTKIECVCVCV